MKRIVTSLVLTALLLISLLPISSFALDKMDGTYEGWYYANQGQTGLTLTLADGEGVFEFYNMPGKSNAKNGSYTVKAVKTDKGYRIDGVEWIDRPSTYSFVYLEGALTGDSFEGLVNGNSSWQFVLKKNNENYQQISDSVFNNHKYEICDEGLTWHEAKAKCEEMGGHLVTITSEEEQAHIEKLLKSGNKKQYWLGATSESGSFEWVTGEEFSYKNWDSGEPNGNKRNDGENELYVHIYNTANPKIYSSKRFCWNDMFFDNTYPGEENNFSMEHIGYICEWDTWTNSAQWSTPELKKAAENGLIPDVLVAKDMTKPITRGEFAAVCVQLFEKMTDGKAVMSSNCSFNDIALNENRNYILKAYNIGAVLGMSDTEYSPDLLLTREQLATMLTRVYKRCQWPDWTIATDDSYTINYSGVQKFADDADISDYAKPSVYFMVKYNVISGVGNNKFAPKNTTPIQEAEMYANATREQAIIMSLRSFENLK